MLLSRSQRRGFDGANAIRQHIAKTGCTLAGQPVWTEAELGTLRALYPDRGALSRSLAGRSLAAIAAKARHLGLVPPRQFWSDTETRLMRRPYAEGMPMSDLLAILPGRTKYQIWRKARHLRIRRPRRPPRITGFPLLDNVRRRAFDLGLTMRDLDSYTGATRYFCGARRQDLRRVQRAILVLGGHILVRFGI